MADDGDEADSLKLQTLAAKASAFRCNDDEDDSSDDEELQSAIDGVDPFVFFVDFVKDNIGASWIGRQGIALALHSVADVLGTKDLPVVMTILISRTLGLIIGSAELREKAALGRGGLIEVSSEQALKEFFIPITGLLIRIIGDNRTGSHGKLKVQFSQL